MGWPPTQPTPAVASVYASKDRPKINPLICHVGAPEEALNWGFSTPMHAVWPSVSGRARSRLSCRGLPAALSANWQAPVSRRWPCGPDHSVARALLGETARPLVAPSANPSGQLSPSQAHHVSAHLPDIDVLDGGACTVGVESTIIGCLEENPTLLRVGVLSRDALEACLDKGLAELPENADRTARLAPVVCCAITRRARRFALMAKPRRRLFAVGFRAGSAKDAAENLSLSGDLNEAAANLFDCLHRLDARAWPRIKLSS